MARQQKPTIAESSQTLAEQKTLFERVRTIVEADGELGEALFERVLRAKIDSADRYFAPLMAVVFGNACAGAVLELLVPSGESINYRSCAMTLPTYNPFAVAKVLSPLALFQQ